ncbi:hypothetical protein J6590_059795 [Homalodisca vitripennis]|nr:hypothetical protein J6590_059795 [Homalodisca vitripennis]
MADVVVSKPPQYNDPIKRAVQLEPLPLLSNPSNPAPPQSLLAFNTGQNHDCFRIHTARGTIDKQKQKNIDDNGAMGYIHSSGWVSIWINIRQEH